jgi:hypothetical protein
MFFRSWPLTRKLTDKLMGLRGERSAETDLEEDLGEGGGHLPNTEIADASPEHQSAIEQERQLRQHRDDPGEER